MVITVPRTTTTPLRSPVRALNMWSTTANVQGGNCVLPSHGHVRRKGATPRGPSEDHAEDESRRCV